VFQEQLHSVNETEAIFGQVQTRMGGFIRLLGSVSDSVRDLERSQNEVRETMASVSAVSQQSSASTQQQVASLCEEQLDVSTSLEHLSDKLDRLSLSLKGSIEKFVF
jgi:methyl-accepting chemotaxis protein